MLHSPGNSNIEVHCDLWTDEHYNDPAMVAEWIGTQVEGESNITIPDEVCKWVASLELTDYNEWLYAKAEEAYHAGEVYYC